MNQSIYRTYNQREEYLNNIFSNDPSLTEHEKKFLIYKNQKKYDQLRINNDSNETRLCPNCQKSCRATMYCEICVRQDLESKFDTWTSGNKEIDELIRNCQRKTVSPRRVIEWVDYAQFQDTVKYIKKGGRSKIYEAIWKDGHYDGWNPENRSLKRSGAQRVILKKLNNSNEKWFQEVLHNFELDYTFFYLAQCFGLTKNPETNEYMLVLYRFDSDLRNLLIKHHPSITWIQNETQLNMQLEIINGVRPEIHKDTPPEYAELMIQCWNPKPDKRPSASKIADIMGALLKRSYEEMGNDELALNTQLIISMNDQEGEGCETTSFKNPSSQLQLSQSRNTTVSSR
ncbi:13235_t:CDS:2 [Acaulospora morrowiae]|uniref:13235_t:CDS:1 n=1 Tax=Acaulospora morrowiae TaxID=94023 RepID=A0A9N9CSN2_9GLOM|nr:13235_t:CDS:2 [Acaulospora morrowiae]